jgi:hypothetical protein
MYSTLHTSSLFEKGENAQHWFNMEDKKNTNFKWDLFCRPQNGKKKKKEETKPHLRNRNASCHPDIPLKW